jgi:hypothetical protein
MRELKRAIKELLGEKYFLLGTMNIIVVDLTLAAATLVSYNMKWILYFVDIFIYLFFANLMLKSIDFEKYPHILLALIKYSAMLLPLSSLVEFLINYLIK